MVLLKEGLESTVKNFLFEKCLIERGSAEQTGATRLYHMRGFGDRSWIS